MATATLTADMTPGALYSQFYGLIPWVVRRFYPHLTSQYRSNLRDWLADELLRAAENFTGVQKFKTYAARCLIHAVKRYCLKHGIQQRAIDKIGHRRPLFKSPADTTAAIDVNAAIAQLSSEDQVIARDWISTGCHFWTYAKKHGITDQAGRQRLKPIIAKLRRKLAAYSPETDNNRDYSPEEDAVIATAFPNERPTLRYRRISRKLGRTMQAVRGRFYTLRRAAIAS